MAMQLNFSVFQLQALPYFTFQAFFFLNLTSLMRQLYLAIIVHLFEKFLLCWKPTSQNTIFVPALVPRTDSNLLFFSKFFHRVCKKREYRVSGTLAILVGIIMGDHL